MGCQVTKKPIQKSILKTRSDPVNEDETRSYEFVNLPPCDSSR